MKLTDAGVLTIDGQPRTGVFIQCSQGEVRQILNLVSISDKVGIMTEDQYSDWATSQEEILKTQ